MDLAHHHIEGGPPLSVVVGELTVLITRLGVLLFVFLPQQQQGDSFAFHLVMKLGPVRLDSSAPGP